MNIVDHNVADSDSSHDDTKLVRVKYNPMTMSKESAPVRGSGGELGMRVDRHTSSSNEKVTSPGMHLLQKQPKREHGGKSHPEVFISNEGDSSLCIHGVIEEQHP